MALRVLIAEDNGQVRRDLKALLESEGFQDVAEALDGREAVKLAQELVPDVVVLDLSMPYLSGIEAARKIREVLPGIRILVLTVHREDQYILQSFQAGADGYILKRHAVAELGKGIRHLAKGKKYLDSGIPPDLVRRFLTNC
jgi:DNA-binding NarL/FixJ family response regulator